MDCSVALEHEIRHATDHLTFTTQKKKADSEAWAFQAHRLGHNAEWAIEWIKAGYSEPPEWVMATPSVEMRRAV